MASMEPTCRVRWAKPPRTVAFACGIATSCDCSRWWRWATRSKSMGNEMRSSQVCSVAKSKPTQTRRSRSQSNTPPVPRRSAVRSNSAVRRALCNSQSQLSPSSQAWSFHLPLRYWLKRSFSDRFSACSLWRGGFASGAARGAEGYGQGVLTRKEHSHVVLEVFTDGRRDWNDAGRSWNSDLRRLSAGDLPPCSSGGHNVAGAAADSLANQCCPGNAGLGASPGGAKHRDRP